MSSILNQSARFTSHLILILVFIVYIPTLKGKFIWDDNFYVAQSEILEDLDGLRRIWSEPGSTIQYYPMVFSSFWVEHHFFGDRPVGYHFTNIILHGFNAVFLRQILIQLAVPGAGWAALIFAVHPVHVESVAWITERKNCLSGFFYLLSLLVYLKFLGIERSSKVIKNKHYIFSLFFFILALLSKSTTCTLPAAILLIIWWNKKGLCWRMAAPTLPFFLCGFLMSAVTIWMERRAGAIGLEWEIHWLDRILIAGRALWFYLGKLFWPNPLIFIYPRWQIDANSFYQLLFPITFLLLIWVLWLKRKEWGRAPMVGILFFLVTLFPALGFINFYPMRFSFVADHFQYIPSISIIALFTAFLTRQVNQKKTFLKIVFPIVLITLMGLTWKQTHIYHDKETLWGDTILKNPSAWIAHNNIAAVYLDQKRNQAAVNSLQEAARLKPDEADIHHTLGIAYARLGRIEDAINSYQETIRIMPNYPAVHHHLGQVYLDHDRYEDALIAFKKELKTQPNIAKSYHNLGVTYIKMGRFEEALAPYQKAIRIRPDFFQAYNNLGFAFLKLDHYAQATKNFQKAIQIKRDFANAYYNLGFAYLGLGLKVKAAKAFQKAIRLKPALAEVFGNKKVILGRPETEKIFIDPK